MYVRKHSAIVMSKVLYDFVIQIQLNVEKRERI